MLEMSIAAPSLYERLGGHETIEAVAEALSRRLLIDGELAYYFAHLDLRALRRHQVAFLHTLLGGPEDFRVAPVRQAHRGLGITGRDCRLVAEHLAAALRACAVPKALAVEVLALFGAWRGVVLAAEG